MNDSKRRTSVTERPVSSPGDLVASTGLRELLIAELEGLEVRFPNGQVFGLDKEIAAHIADHLLTSATLADFIPATCTCPRGRSDFDYGRAGTHHNPDRCPLWMIP